MKKYTLFAGANGEGKHQLKYNYKDKILIYFK
ncbi:hypothetical protein CLOSAC_20400 [Clostridium saccharobutylicum]|uniref:Uncharacterized protein n=1 Tax=Clostridium saccharobutylicum TaxID=169679 RepID=A0A1S8NBT4_CLOSA|nr:hypothetical protein CLOSAC_20400 [Clostridium saccharobutylicum]